MTVSSKTLDELAQRIVDAVHPLRIVVFGSAARGDMKTQSDVDVLVVMPDGTHRRHTAQEIYPRLIGFAIPVDVVVATPADLEKYGDTIGLIYRRAIQEGKEIYAAETVVTWAMNCLDSQGNGC